MDDELFENICINIAGGMSVQAACAKLETRYEYFYRAINLTDQNYARYARAREARADVRFDRMDELLDDIRKGVVDPAAGRVLMDGIKWMAGKEKSKVYGDNLTLKGDKENPLTLNLAAVLDQRISNYQKTIEHEPALPIVDISSTESE